MNLHQQAAWTGRRPRLREMLKKEPPVGFSIGSAGLEIRLLGFQIPLLGLRILGA
jgi:hypothetical protein